MDSKPAARVTSASSDGAISTELSSRRTGMSFQRTRMSADRTLMSVMRTSLSLIGFGFTIFQFFERLHEAQVLKSTGAARHFGEALVYLGIGMLAVGIGYHVSFMLGLRKERVQLKADGLIHAESQFPLSLTLLVAILLLFIGLGAIVSMVFNVGPFGGEVLSRAGPS
jgi:putative membrane protein